MRVMLVLLCLPACSLYFDGGGNDDDGNDDGVSDDTGPAATCAGDPDYVPGGGTTGPEGQFLDGSLALCVVDAFDEQPLAGAVARLRDGTTATIDAAGRATFSGLVGMQEITILADGYVPTTWDGIGGVSGTIVVERLSPPAAAASGTIAGWDALPAPRRGHRTVAVVSYSKTPTFEARENHLAQDGAAHTCVRTATESSCAWRLVTRTGPQVHTAVILDVDESRTPDDTSDDVATVIGYAVGSPVTLSDGERLDDETLTLLANAELAPLEVDLLPGPDGRDTVAAIPFLDLGEAGRVEFPALTAAAPAMPVIAPAGAWSGTYFVAAIASPTIGGYPRTRVTEYVPVPSLAPVPVPMSEWPIPYTLSSCGADCWALPESRTMHFAWLSRDGAPVWNHVTFGMGSWIKIPTGIVDQGGPYDMRVEVCSAGGWDSGHFAAVELASACDLSSEASITVIR